MKSPALSLVCFFVLQMTASSYLQEILQLPNEQQPVKIRRVVAPSFYHCDYAIAGAIRFNNASKLVEVCDGDMWRSLVWTSTLTRSCGNCLMGTKREYAAISCREIAQTCQSAVDGIYWIKPFSDSLPFQVFCDMTSDDGIGYTVVARFSDKTYFVLDEVNLNAENKIIVPGFVQSKSSKMPDSLINKLYTSQVKWTTTDNPTYSMYFQLACGQTYTTTGTMNQRCSRYLPNDGSKNQKGVDSWSVWYTPKVDYGLSTRDWGSTNTNFCEYGGRNDTHHPGVITLRHRPTYWDACGRSDANGLCSSALNAFLMVA